MIEPPLSRRPAGRGSAYTWRALALVMALVLTLVSAWRQGWFTPTSQVYLELRGASGLQLGTPVRLKGFKIGEVDEIQLERTLNVRVRLRLDKHKMELLSADARARLGRDSPIAARHIELIPGKLSGQRLAVGQTLPVDSGSEIDDLMVTIKDAVTKLSVALDKANPILDDVRLLTRETAAMRETLSGSLTRTLGHVEALSAQLRQTGTAAHTLVGQLDGDRARVVGDLRGVLEKADAAAASTGDLLKTLRQEMPTALGRTQALLDNAQAASADLKQVLQQLRQDVPGAARTGRGAVQDAADMAAGLKKAWPLSSVTEVPPPAPLPLDGFEGAPR